MGKHLERYEALNKALKMYKPSLAPPSREQIELFRVLLHETVTLDTLISAFLATFPPDDPSLPTRKDGVKTFYEGVAGMLFGSVQIADNRQVEAEDRLVVFSYLTEVAPVLLPKTPELNQQAIRLYVGRLVEATTGTLHDAAVRLQHAVEAPRTAP